MSHPNKNPKNSPSYKPAFMEWGIINNDNFISITDVPIKRWDPLSTVLIESSQFGSKGSVTRHYGHYSYISPIRGKRPQGYQDFEKKSEIKPCSEDSLGVKDSFMADIEGEPVILDDGSMMGDGYSIIITEDEMRRDDPFLDLPHRAGPVSKSAKALTLINRYPAMARIIEPKIHHKVQAELPEKSRIAMGINLVTVSRDFYPSICFNLVPEEVLSALLLSMKAAILYSVERAIESDYYDILVSPFFNIGRLVGGSQPRLHSQVYIDLSGDGHGSRLEGFLEAFKEMGHNCHLCSSSHGESSRMVFDSEYWSFFTTGSPVRNYHLRFHPKEHLRRFSNLNVNQIKDLASCLKIVFRALDLLKIDRNRNILFNCCPYGYDADFHLFGDIIPHEIIGGAEMADDMRVARKLPEETAEEIRKMILKLQQDN